jgi:hypothetical protein
MRQQDDDLEEISKTVGTLGEMGKGISAELNQHARYVLAQNDQSSLSVFSSPPPFFRCYVLFFYFVYASKECALTHCLCSILDELDSKTDQTQGRLTGVIRRVNKLIESTSGKQSHLMNEKTT